MGELKSIMLEIPLSDGIGYFPVTSLHNGNYILDNVNSYTELFSLLDGAIPQLSTLQQEQYADYIETRVEKNKKSNTTESSLHTTPAPTKNVNTTNYTMQSKNNTSPPENNIKSNLSDFDTTPNNTTPLSENYNPNKR